MSETEPPVSQIEGAPADSAMPGLLGALPAAARPYAALARLDRPVGIWLLYLPCVIGLFFTRIFTGFHAIDLWWLLLFFIGSVAMRGAGCTWNDISDRDLDREVARTASRPLPSGQVEVWQAYAFLVLQLAIGFLVWLALPTDAKIVALLALPLVGAYPFMKRLTWWPQAWLGATFNWGALVAAATAEYISLATLILYAGLAVWTIAYDTIYAMQDAEDDALVGIKSTARLFGERAVLASFAFHVLAAALIALAASLMGAQRIGAVTALAFIAHGLWQAMQLKTRGGMGPLAVFKSNVTAGALIALGFGAAALVPEPQPKSLFAEHETIPEVTDNQWPFSELPIKRPSTANVPEKTVYTERLPIWTSKSGDGDIWMLTTLQRLSNEYQREAEEADTAEEPLLTEE